MELPKGDSFSGAFVDGVPEGKGIMSYGNGGLYDGEFIRGQRDGYGVYKYALGHKYDGEWRNDKWNGKGSLLFLPSLRSRGFRYEGGFANGKRTGIGIIQYDNGDVFKGEFSDDLRNGRGQLALSNGVKYQGEFRDDVPHGVGKMHDPMRKITFIAQFKEGAVDVQLCPITKKPCLLTAGVCASCGMVDVTGAIVEEVFRLGALVGEIDSSLRVLEVEKDSVADNVGLQKGDYILYLNDTRISTSEDFRELLEVRGDSSELTVLAYADRLFPHRARSIKLRQKPEV